MSLKQEEALYRSGLDSTTPLKNSTANIGCIEARATTSGLKIPCSGEVTSALPRHTALPATDTRIISLFGSRWRSRDVQRPKSLGRHKTDFTQRRAACGSDIIPCSTVKMLMMMTTVMRTVVYQGWKKQAAEPFLSIAASGALRFLVMLMIVSGRALCPVKEAEATSLEHGTFMFKARRLAQVSMSQHASICLQLQHSYLHL